MSHKVFIFVPAFRDVVSKATFLSVHALHMVMAQHGIGGHIASESLCDVSELRNIVLTVFYDKTDCTHLLMIDNDMGFPPQLILDMLAFAEPLTGAMYPQRTLPLTWAGSGLDGSTAERRGDFMKVAGVGGGVMLIHRTVVGTMLANMPEMNDTRLEMHPAEGMFKNMEIKRIIRAFDNIYLPQGRLAEDLSFCLRWRECGGSVWANIAHRISHVGNYDFGARYLDLVEAEALKVAAE